MKKGLTTLLVILLAVGAMLVSCKAEVATPADELVSVSFEMGSSRALSATLEEFDSNQFVWKYSAKKDASDTTGLISGQTANYDTDVVGAAYVAGPTVKGLAGKQVTGFSQGIWDFKLFAYNDDGKIVYSGEVTGVTLKKSGTTSEHTVKVTVSPVAEGDGKLILDMAHITIKAASVKSEPSVSSQYVVTDKDGHVVNTAPTVDNTTHEVTYTLPAGIYKVTVTFKDAYGIVYAEGSVLATVYPYLKTRITGDLSELITYAQFEAEQNPDAVKVSAESEELSYNELITDPVVFSNTPETPEDKTVKATMNQADVNAIIKEMAINAGVNKSDSTLKLTLNVDPTAATETEITYEIGMTAKLTTTVGETTSFVESDVKNLDNYVVVEISMEKNLLNVAVNHDGTPMYQYLTNAAFNSATSEVPGYSGFFFYDAENGALYIKTKSFSPFSISFEVPGEENPVYEARIGSKMYEYLADALEASEDGETIVLLKNLSDAYYKIYNENQNKSYVIDLNGFTISGGKYVFDIYNGSLELTGSGSVVGESYTIWVGDYDSAETIPAKLVIGENVTVIADSMYAVTLYGKAEESLEFGQELEVSGKILSGGSAIGGTGNSGYGKTKITIKDGAVLSSTGTCIYHPQRGSLTIGNATISGETAVEMKSGTLNISGNPTISATVEASHVPYSNGSSTSGYAIAAIQNNDYYGEVKVSISGGTFNGPVAILVDSDVPSSKEASLQITGGSFSRNPWKYVADGYEAIYNPSTGLWTVSEIPGDGVAKIGTDYYNSLQAAIDNAGSTGTKVELLRNVDLTSILFIDNSVVLEGNFHEVTNTQNRVIRVRQPNLNISIKDLTITSKWTGDDGRGISFDTASSGSELLLDGCSVSAPYYVINVVLGAENLDVTIKNGTFAAGWAAINSYSNNSKWTIENSVLKGLNDKGESEWNNFNTITFDGYTLYGAQPGHYGTGNTITISDSTVYASSMSGNIQNWIGLQFGASNNSVVVDSDTLIIDEDGEDVSNTWIVYNNTTGNTITVGEVEIYPVIN